MKNMILVVVVGQIAIGCVLSTWDTRLRLVNDTNTTIRYIDELMPADDVQPSDDDCDRTELYSVKPGQEEILTSPNKWEIYFKNHPKHVLRVFIIAEDTFQTHGKCDVIRRGLFAKRFDLTLKDLEDRDWKIVYGK